MDPSPVTAVFVYGTLKRGQCRERYWPHQPHRIVSAQTLGTLFGREDYPAMTPGEQIVQGELWKFLPDQMDRVLQVLDEVEGVPDLYHRVLVQTTDEHAQPIGPAWTYHYAIDPVDDGFTPIAPSADGLVCWP